MDFRDNKFGMFIHWGIYAAAKLQEQAIARYNIDRGAYEKLALAFNPAAYNPEEWITLAKKCRDEIYLLYCKASRRLLYVGHEVF